VVSSAVQKDNPEVAEARRRGIAVIPRGEMLAELMRLKYGVATAGSHGKTTTTSMIASVLSGAGLDPTVVVGGRVAAMGGTNARVGQSEFLVVESDESDGSFLKLAPILAIVTNIDREHLDHYGSFDAVVDAFADFVNKVPFYGAAILCLDDANVRRMLPRVTRRTVTYGASPDADLRILEPAHTAAGSDFRLQRNGEDLGPFHLNVPGAHNVLNATAAAAIGLELGLTADQIRTGLADFGGVERRFQLKGQAAGVTVVDDYGHHPTEIQATLATARLLGRQRVLVLFQPHRFTRTQDLLDEFSRSFDQADVVWITDIYGASEAAIPGVTGEALAKKIVAHGHSGASWVGGLEAGVAEAVKSARAGDLLITMGAGTVSRAADMIVHALGGRN
jgi:UDP-N-acetylmuramate--alanine ligase